MEKLKLIGFKNDFLKVIFSFLSHRNQQVVINYAVSDIEKKSFEVYRREQYLGHYFLTSTLIILQNTSRKNAELYNPPMTV